MIQIEVYSDNVPGGRAFAKLFENTRINFVIDNLAIQATVTPGEYTLPINFPRRCINDVIFDYVHEIPKNNRKIEFPAWVYYKGVPIYKGTLVIHESGDTHQGHIKIMTAGLSCLNLKLSEIDLGGDIDLGADQSDRYDFLTSKLVQSYPDTTFNLPMIHNPRFYDDKNNAYLEFMNLYDIVHNRIAQNFIDSEDRDDNNPNNWNAIVPMPYLVHIIKSGFNMDNVKATGSWLDDYDTQKILVYNNRSLDTQINRYGAEAAQAFVYAIATTDDINTFEFTPIFFYTELVDPDNAFDPLLTSYEIQAEGWHSFSGIVMADIVVPNLQEFEVYMIMAIDGVVVGTPVNGESIVGIFNSTVVGTYDDETIGYYFRHYFSAADIGKKITFYFIFNLSVNTSGLFVSAVFEPSLVLCKYTNESILLLNQLPEKLNLNKHVPDITFGELLQAYRDSDNLKFSYDLILNKVTIALAEEAFDQPVIDITDIAEPDHSIELIFDKYKHFNYEIDSTDELSEDKTDQPFDGTVSGSVDAMQDLSPGGATNRSIFYVRNLNMFVKALIEPLVPIQWLKHSQGFPNYVVNTDGFEIIAKNQPMYMARVSYPMLPIAIMVPQIKQRGSTLAYSIGDNKFNLRQLFYHGMQGQQFPIVELPQGSSSNMNYNGDLLGSRNMYWHTDIGLIETFWAQWIKAMNNGEPVTLNIHFKLHQLINFNIYRRYRYRTRDFFIKKLELGIDEHLTPCKTEMILLKK